MPIQVSCSSCGTRASAPDSAAGRKGKCRKCGGTVVIPAAVGTMAAPTSSFPISGATKSIKSCAGCGKDVSQEKRIKNEQGHYFCHPCWAASQQTPQSTTVQPTEPEHSISSPAFASQSSSIFNRIQPPLVAAPSVALPTNVTESPAQPKHLSATTKILSVLAKRKRIVIGAAAAVVVIGGVLIFIHMQIDDAAQSQVDALGRVAAEERKAAEISGKKSEQYDQALRESAQGGNDSPRKTKSQLVDEDAVVQEFIGQYRQFEYILKHLNRSGKQEIDTFCLGMVAAGKIDLQTVRYFDKFMDMEMDAPD